MNSILHIWSDGACSGNPGPGGYSGIVFLKPRPICICGYSELTTNNRMELTGLIDGLRYALEHKPEDITKIIIHTDSKYVSNPINCGWLTKWSKKEYANKKNSDLWRIVEELLCTFDIEVEWVKGHSGVKENELADLKAVQAMEYGWPLSTVIEL